ncbi:MAG: SH3 domain-containing protein [Prevotella sp.]|nr:SH3 domain-containing protein [Prevotella sp.]
MKRFFFIFVAFMMSSAMWAQNVFTVVYATSDDGFVNVRQKPSMKAAVLTKLYEPMHGLGSGILLGKSGNWSKVRVGKFTGWAYSKYVGEQTWYEGNGQPRLVANKVNTPIYTDNLKDGGINVLFATVSKGTIIADTYKEDGAYYMLVTAHDNLYVKKSDVKIVR